MNDRRHALALGAAIVAVWFFWGAVPAGMRLAMLSLPPYVMATFRFAVAGAVIWAVALALGRGRPTAAMLRYAVVSAFFLLFLGNGLMTWSLQYLPTGINALLMSIAPVWLALVEWIYARIVPGRIALAGMLLGIAGTAVLFGPHDAGAFPLVPAAVALASSVCFAIGSAIQRHAPPANGVLSTALLMLAAAVMLGIEAAVVGDWARWGGHALQPAAIFGLAWIIVCGSLVSYPAYLYTMRYADAALATTYAYVNPLVTIGLGMLLFGERFTVPEAVAAALMLAGVVLMVLPRYGGVQGARRFPTTCAMHSPRWSRSPFSSEAERRHLPESPPEPFSPER